MTVADGDRLDYSFLLSSPGGAVDGLLVEEFLRDDDHTTVALGGLVWTAADPRWLSSPSFSRTLRTDPDLLARVTPTDRAGAADAYRRLGGGDLPSGPDLRGRFRDHEPFATAAPLRLGPTRPPDGFHERRLYRVLFAKDLDPGGLADLNASWPQTTVRQAADDFTWELRRVGRGIAWALDVTVLLAGPTDDTVGPVLRDLTATVRRHGLVPVTTERFA